MFTPSEDAPTHSRMARMVNYRSPFSRRFRETGEWSLWHSEGLRRNAHARLEFPPDSLASAEGARALERPRPLDRPLDQGARP